MTRPHQFVFLIVISVTLAACTSVQTYMPNAYVESPEIRHVKNDGANLVIRNEPGQIFDLVDNAAERPLKISPSRMSPIGFSLRNLDHEESREVSLGLPVAGVSAKASGRLQWGIAGFPINFWFTHLGLYTRTHLKYQLVGPVDNSEGGTPHRLAVFTHLLWSYFAGSGDQKALFGSGGYKWKANAENRGLGFGASYGYKFNSNVLGYFGGAWQPFDVTARVKQEETATGDFPADAQGVPRTYGYSQTGAIGVFIGTKGRLQITYSYSEAKWGEFRNHIHFLTFGGEG